MMLMVWYSARNESSVVNEPAPAIKGNAIGTMEVPPGASCLKSSTPKIISNAKKRSTNEPAMANDEISTPNISSKASPIKRNAIRMIKETEVAFRALISPDFFFKSRIIGTEPKISMTAKRTINAEKISSRSSFML